MDTMDLSGSQTTSNVVLLAKLSRPMEARTLSPQLNSAMVHTLGLCSETDTLGLCSETDSSGSCTKSAAAKKRSRRYLSEKDEYVSGTIEGLLKDVFWCIYCVSHNEMSVLKNKDVKEGKSTRSPILNRISKKGNSI